MGKRTIAPRERLRRQGNFGEEGMLLTDEDRKVLRPLIEKAAELGYTPAKAEVENKYAHFTDLIYVSIFREKAKEYVLSYAGKKEVSAFTNEYLKVKNSGQLTPPNPSDIHSPPLPCARRG